MMDVFVKTENITNFLAKLEELKRRGAGEACLMVVEGDPGTGKSETLEWCAIQQDWVSVRAKREWTPAWMLRELLDVLRVPPAPSFEKMYRQLLEALSLRAQAAEREDETFCVVIDEIDHIVRRVQLLETLRDLSDYLEIPFIFVGMDHIRPALTRFKQISSRVGKYCPFVPAPLHDVREMVTRLCEVEVKDDLVAYLHKVAVGLAREVKEGIASIERFGLRNPGPIGRAEMAGQVLLYDRRTGQPIKVPAPE